MEVLQNQGDFHLAHATPTEKEIGQNILPNELSHAIEPINRADKSVRKI